MNHEAAEQSRAPLGEHSRRGWAGLGSSLSARWCGPEVPGLGSRGLGLLSVLQLNSEAKRAGRLGGSGVGGPAHATSRRDLTPENAKEGEGLRAEVKRLGGESSEGHCCSSCPERPWDRGVERGSGGHGDLAPHSYPSSGGLRFLVYREASGSPTVTLAYE